MNNYLTEFELLKPKRQFAISKYNLRQFVLHQLPPTKVGDFSLISMWSNRRIFLPHSLLFTTKQLRLLFRKIFLNPQVDELRH